MAGKESHKKRQTEHRKKVQKAVAHVDNHRETGILEIPQDLPFADFVRAVHREEARYDPNTQEYEAIGRIKHDLIARIIGVDSGAREINQTDSRQVPTEELPESRTAYRFYQSVLTVFEPFPWEIPFSAVNTLAHRVGGEDFASVRELIKEEGSEVIVAEAASKHRKLNDLWESYYLNRSAGININAYFAKNPRLSTTKHQR